MMWHLRFGVLFLAVFCMQQGMVQNAPQAKKGKESPLIVPEWVRQNSLTEGSYFPGNLDLQAIIDAVMKGKITPAVCDPCRQIMDMVLQFVATGHNPDSIIATIKAGCVMLRVASQRVCFGTVELLKDEVLTLAKSTNSSSTEICSVIMGNVCGFPTSPEHNWTLTINSEKPPVVDIPKPEVNQTVLRVLHLTDTHYDPSYKEGFAGECSELLCCEKESGIPEDPILAAGKWGYGPMCDVPFRTVENLLDNVKNEKVDYVVWGGDLIPHRPWELSREMVLEIFHTTADLISRKLPSIPVYPTLGNHDTVPQDFFPVPEITGKFSASWIYDEVAKIWGRWLPESTQETIKKGGYYVVDVKPGLKVISLNTNYCYQRNWWLVVKSADPGDQLSWLIEQLEKAEQAGDKVHIVGHVPPATKDCLTFWSSNYRRILYRFENTVRAQFFGHTHLDHFFVSYDPEEEDRPTSVSFVGPSVSTFETNHPSYKMYTIDGDHAKTTWTVLDFETYMLNLTEAKNLKDNESPSWNKVYSAKDAYQLDSLLPSDMHKLVKSFWTDDELFQTYYRYYKQLGSHESTQCDDKCKASVVCGITSSEYTEAQQCS